MQRTLWLANRTARYTNHFGWRRGGILALVDRPSNDRLVTLTWSGYECPFRIRLNASDLRTFLEVIAEEVYRLPFKTEPATIIDVGANIGLTSVWFAARYPAAKVLAIEPDAANYALLVENTQAYRNVTTIQAALWSDCGRVLLVNHGLGSCTYSVESSRDEKPKGEPTGAVLVDAVDLETVMSAHDIDRIDVLKVDVEGAEKEIFSSSYTWINRVDSIAIELHDRYKPGCSRAFYRATAGFSNEETRGESTFVWRSQARASADNGRSASTIGAAHNR